MDKGKIRVGVPLSSYDSYKNIIVMTPSNAKKWYPLSPYSLKDENGYIMENVWQFGKVYEKVPNSVQRYSRWDKTIIWEYPEQIHVENNKITKEYYQWRQLGMENKFAVRYPVGMKARSTVLYYLDEDGSKYDWIESRKKVYLPLYTRLAKQTQEFQELKKMLNNGVNLLIIEPDGPKQQSLEYYQEKYGVSENFIKGGSILVNKKNMEIMLNDERHSFGHGYCLALALLDIDLD